MASLTVRNIDADVKSRLRLRAARNGRSMEEEVRVVLREAADAVGRRSETEEERKERVRQMLSFARHDPEPFDLKAFSDALSSGNE